MSYPPLCLNIVSMKDWYFPVERERRKQYKICKHSLLTFYFFHCSTLKVSKWAFLYVSQATQKSSMKCVVTCTKLTFLLQDSNKMSTKQLLKNTGSSSCLLNEHFLLANGSLFFFLSFDFQFMLIRKTINKIRFILYCYIAYLTLFLFLQCKEYTSSKLCL